MLVVLTQAYSQPLLSDYTLIQRGIMCKGLLAGVQVRAYIREVIADILVLLQLYPPAQAGNIDLYTMVRFPREFL